MICERCGQATIPEDMIGNICIGCDRELDDERQDAANARDLARQAEDEAEEADAYRASVGWEHS